VPDVLIKTTPNTEAQKKRRFIWTGAPAGGRTF